MAEARRRKGLHVHNLIVQNLIARPAHPLGSAPDGRPMLLTGGWAALRALWIPPAEVRAELWAIGVRHGGRVVEGAREEGRATGLSLRRAILLKAVIREHGRAMQALGQ